MSINQFTEDSYEQTLIDAATTWNEISASHGMWMT